MTYQVQVGPSGKRREEVEMHRVTPCADDMNCYSVKVV